MLPPQANNVELELLRAEQARCQRCRQGHHIACDGVRAVYDQKASTFYGTTKIVYEPCEFYLQLRHRAARERAVKRSGLPGRWLTADLPRLPDKLSGVESCGVVPSALTPEHTVQSSYLVQAAVMGCIACEIQAKYWFVPSLSFDRLSRVTSDLEGEGVVALDRWDGGSLPPTLLAQMCSLLEQRLALGGLVIIGLLRPFELLEPRDPSEMAVLGMLGDLPRVDA